jgi:PAS domain S-box-containing protein
MKSFFTIEDNGQGMEDLRTFLREHGYSVTESGPESHDELRFTQFAIDHACVQVFWVSQDQRITYVNDAACHTMGYSREELTRMSVGDIDPYFPSRDDARFCEHWRALRESGYARFETSHRSKDGRMYPVEIQSNFLEFEGKEYSCCFVTDITDRRKAEELLRASLDEKTILLKEVHHRVKNNLQIICALLDLQSDSIPDEHSRRYFQGSQDRIRSMALVHEQLYRSRDFASVDFDDYIDNLATYLFNSYVRDPGRISLRVDAEHVTLTIDQSIPCGLILNELVSNSLKHAFPDNRSGEITIGLIAGADGWITLTVRDDGVGCPADLDSMNSRSLGLPLVDMLVKQLQGRIETRNDNGASCVVRFRGAEDE